MKKRFGFMLILLLTYAFMSCPALINRAFAGENPTHSAGKGQLIRIFLQMAGKGDAVPDFKTTLPTTIQELIDAITNSDIAKQIKAANDKRVETRTDRVERLKEWFGVGGTKPDK